MERVGRDEGQRPAACAGTYVKLIAPGVRARGCNGDLEVYLGGLRRQEGGVVFASFALTGIFNSPGYQKFPGRRIRPEIIRFDRKLSASTGNSPARKCVF
jgi:uncharacterized protein (DUF2141 family)